MLVYINNTLEREFQDPAGLKVTYLVGFIPGWLKFVAWPPPNESGLFDFFFEVRPTSGSTVRYGIHTGAGMLMPAEGSAVSREHSEVRADFTIAGRLDDRIETRFHVLGEKHEVCAWRKYLPCKFSVTVGNNGMLMVNASFPVSTYKNAWLAEDMMLTCSYHVPVHAFLWQSPGTQYTGNPWLELVRDRQENKLPICPYIIVH